MPKCKKEMVQAAALKLAEQITQTMPSTLYKFMLGGAATFASISSTEQLDKLLKYVSDENGLVDVGLVEKLADGAFKASGDKVQLELFNGGGLANLFVKPVTLTITRQDAQLLIDELKRNCVAEEVSLSKPQA